MDVVVFFLFFEFLILKMEIVVLLGVISDLVCCIEFKGLAVGWE